MINDGCLGCYHEPEPRDSEICSLCVAGSERVTEQQYKEEQNISEKKAELARLEKKLSSFLIHKESEPFGMWKSEKDKEEWRKTFNKIMDIEKEMAPRHSVRRCSSGRMCYCAPFEGD